MPTVPNQPKTLETITLPEILEKLEKCPALKAAVLHPEHFRSLVVVGVDETRDPKIFLSSTIGDFELIGLGSRTDEMVMGMLAQQALEKLNAVQQQQKKQSVLVSPGSGRA